MQREAMEREAGEERGRGRERQGKRKAGCVLSSMPTCESLHGQQLVPAAIHTWINLDEKRSGMTC